MFCPYSRDIPFEFFDLIFLADEGFDDPVAAYIF
jgi:hypothetical protein